LGIGGKYAGASLAARRVPVAPGPQSKGKTITADERPETAGRKPIHFTTDPASSGRSIRRFHRFSLAFRS
jgi:hypothetical protein